MKRQYDSQYDKMTQMPVPNLVVNLAIPTTISMMVAFIYNIVDTYFVSQLGTSAAAATGVVFALMFIIQAFGFLLGHGAGSNISRKLGARNPDDAKKYSATSFYLAIVCGLFIMTVGILFLDPLMTLLGSTDTILPFSREYGKYILIAAPATAGSNVLSNILRYEGKATYSMFGMMAGSLLNILGDYIFIFVLDMGITGAGLSTTISFFISMMVLLIPFISGKTQSSLNIKFISLNTILLWNIVTVGFPSMVRQGLNSISTMILNLMAAPFGDAAIAAMSIVSRVGGIIFCICLGIGQGFQPVVAFNYGAKKFKRVRESFNFTVKLNTIVITILSLIVLLVSKDIIALFRDDADVIRIGVFALQAQCVSMILQPLTMCGNMMFQSIGKSGTALFLSCQRSGLFFIPIIIVLSKTIGITGIQLSQPIADVFAAIVTTPFIIHFFRHLPKEDMEIGHERTPYNRVSSETDIISD